jgi:hypothetical protein
MTPVTPSTAPAARPPTLPTLTAASDHYESAITLVQTRVRKDLGSTKQQPWLFVASAAARDVTQAAALLEPLAESDDPRVSRNVRTSLELADEARNLLADSIDPTVTAAPPVNDIATTIRSANLALRAT